MFTSMKELLLTVKTNMHMKIMNDQVQMEQKFNELLQEVMLYKATKRKVINMTTKRDMAIALILILISAITTN